jgi:hypothetical protein
MSCNHKKVYCHLKHFFLVVAILAIVSLVACEENSNTAPSLAGTWSINEGESTGTLYLAPSLVGIASGGVPSPYEFSCHIKSGGFDGQLNEAGSYTFDPTTVMTTKDGRVYGNGGKIYFNPASGPPWSSEYQIYEEEAGDVLMLDIPMDGGLLVEFQR